MTTHGTHAEPARAHRHESPGDHANESAHADLLTLDAEVVGHLDELTGWVAEQAACLPRAVLDVGAGTGTGTLALARRFPHARLVALDQSATMLERVRTAGADLGDRVDVVQADLDAGWPEVGTFDLAWAASSLHHVADPDRVLGDLHAALEPGGLLAVVEMDGLPRFLPADLGVGRPGLEERCRAAMAQSSWNAHPNWGPHLQRAGFEVLQERTFAYRRHPAPPAANRYAHGVYGNVRTGLADRLDADDLETLDQLLDGDTPGSLLRRRDLDVRSSRTVWSARRA